MEKQKLSIKTLFKDTLNIIRKDPIILTPYLFFFVIVQFIESYLKIDINAKFSFDIATLSWISFIWGFELFTKALTIVFANDILDKGKIFLKANLALIAKRFFALLLSMGLLTGLVLVTIKLFIFSADNSSLLSIALALLSSITVIIISMHLEFIPVILLLKNKNVINTVISTHRFIKNNLKNVLIIFGLIILTALISGFFRVALSNIPLLGKSIITSIINAVSLCFIYSLVVVFYKETVKPIIDELR
jgi:hypothetical protein